MIQRFSGLTGLTQIINMSGAGDVIRNCTIDGASVVNGSADLIVSGANSLIDHIQAIGGAGTIQVDLGGQNSRITQSTITGIGGTGNQIYGLWALTGATVMVDHNYISNTSIDCIGINGKGSIAEANIVSGCHTYTGGGGGEIGIYPSPSSTFLAAIVSGAATISGSVTGPPPAVGDYLYGNGPGVSTTNGTHITAVADAAHFTVAPSQTITIQGFFTEDSQPGVSWVNNTLMQGGGVKAGGLGNERRRHINHWRLG